MTEAKHTPGRCMHCDCKVGPLRTKDGKRHARSHRRSHRERSMTAYTVIKHHATSRSDITTESAYEAFAFYCRGTVQWVNFVEVKIDGEAVRPEVLEACAVNERRDAAGGSPL